ncbi:Ubiquitin carboxyl-terminal hydrolase-related protein [Hirschfeldia incana]|nr:Ubiquitin carboxyl-terminal hydrolase-related protein [Hirschfeldia incana]
MNRFPPLEDAKAEKLFKLAKDHYAQGNHIKALEVIQDLSRSAKGNDKNPVAYLHGTIFRDLAEKTESPDLKATYLLGSVEIFTACRPFSALATLSLFNLAQLLDSKLYYKKTLAQANEVVGSAQKLEHLRHLVETAESKLADFKNGVTHLAEDSDDNSEEDVIESDDDAKIESDFVRGLKSYWLGLGVDKRRDFMKVSIEGFTSYVQRVYGTKGRDALEEVLGFVRKDKRWRLWVCRSCLEEFSSAEECKNHLEQEHGAGFQARVAIALAQRISEAWGCMITSDGGWEPVDTLAAVEMIKNRFGDKKPFVYENGWSKDLPLASANEERSKLLREIRLLLVTFCDRKILSRSVTKWMVDRVVNYLEKLGVSKHSLTECGLVETPQSICFLGCPQLNQILDLLKRIKCERDDATELVCRAVESCYNGNLVREKIDFDMKFSSLLLDKRLLLGKIGQFDEEGAIRFLNANAHYAKANAGGDDIISWLTDSGDERFQFPRPLKAHNLDVWMAVLGAVQFTCRTLGTQYYAKRLRVRDFCEVLVGAMTLCIGEDERRRNTPDGQKKKYASLLCDECEKKHLVTDADSSIATRLYCAAVVDILKGEPHPKFGLPELEDCLNVIRDHRNVSDDVLMNSLNRLKSVMTDKVPLIDSKIFLVENSRLSLINDLVRLSVFDYRSYIIPPLKEFLLEGIVDLECKAKLASAQADRLLEEEEMKSQPKKKKNNSRKDELAAAEALKLLSKNGQDKEKNSGSKKKRRRNKKRTSTSMPGTLDQNVERVTSPSPKPGEEDSMEHDQEEAAKDMQNMPGEESPSKHLEPAHVESPPIYNSALAMTLKALCHILKEYLVQNGNQFYDHREERVPCAIGNFFTAFVSKEMKKGLYSCLLSDLLSSIEEVYSMTSHAAELLVSILESWPCWECLEIESVVTHIFTLEGYERISCSTCKKKPNYPEQSSYGIVMAADSIRDLKCTFGDIKFEDVLKMIRMEDKMLCDIKTGGCGKANFVHHIISRCPPIFTVVLEWEKHETEKEISEATEALDWEIDMSRLYEGLQPNTKYRLVSMVGFCGEEEEYICLAYKKNRWVSYSHEASSAKEVVGGNWKSVVTFCGDRKVRPEILFYEAFQ